jgi:hypothetical protein
MTPDRESLELVAERSSVVEARSIPSPAPLAASAAVLGPEPPWSPPPDANHVDWEVFASYPHYLAAHIVAGLLENEGLPVIVSAWSAFPGAVSATLWVPKHLLHRARWIAALSAPSDAELLFLATGDLSPEEGRPEHAA